MKRGTVRSGEDRKGKGCGAASPPPKKPSRIKMKRDAKPDGCKTRAKRRKNRGARRPGRVGEGAAPKSEMQRGYGEGPGDRSRLFRLAETATPVVARPRGVGQGRAIGGQPGTGGPPGGGSAPQQCGAGGRGARSLYSAAVGVSAPFPPPEAPPPRRWPGRPHTYANMERGIGSAPCRLFGTGRSLPCPHPRYWTGSGGWRGWRACRGGVEGTTTPERRGAEEGSRSVLRRGPRPAVGD